ncbi:hypothetical protein HMJ29_07420 [Hymenobacter taeanensis]|uniref:Uncharacterized protein n=1 Tax=Hymenobacter taeanensis TaxID=2735321 RepID=A0A6M6BEX5_9BACT|nr:MULTISPECIES: hypothetical protein [Hymenobacter]QJX46777.1 hypothetical protein HMJ29_07420 [Hymenobacter taeanensis]UOQ80646.1 hypothetical protein MUN83_17765 [Hymenobacter sp. 5414T-23]
MQHSYRFLLGLSLSALTFSARAQSVGVGTTTPDPNAALDISAGTGNNKGLLIPRVTEAQRIAITTTTPGMLVFQTNGAQPGFWYFQNNVWVALPSGTTTSSAWQRAGNAGTDPGTNPGVGSSTSPGTDFIGTADNKDVVVRTNNTERLRITTDGSLYSRSAYGLILNANDAPLITRGWDPFTSGSYNGLGRWGLFMRASSLTSGIPDLGGKTFSWVTWNANSNISSTLMTLLQTGQLGLGTVTPAQTLDVVGTLGLRNTAAWDHLFISHDGSTAAVTAGGAETGLALRVGASAAGTYNDASQNYRDVMRLMPSGNVGIGTTNPGAMLEVAGQVKITGGAPGVGKVLTSDGTGLATWQAAANSATNIQTTNTFTVPTTGTGTLNATTGIVILPNNSSTNGTVTLGTGTNGQTLTITNLDPDAVSITSTSGTGTLLPNFAAQFVYVVNGTTSGWFRVN